MNWISVKEQLPTLKPHYIDDAGVAIVIILRKFANQKVTLAYYFCNDMWLEMHRMNKVHDVTHWMPLPEAPK